MTGRELILLIIALIVIFLIAWTKPTIPADINALAEFQDGKVNVYRVIDGETTCYVTVGKLHGYTVAINCVKEMECQQKF